MSFLKLRARFILFPVETVGLKNFLISLKIVISIFFFYWSKRIT